MSSDQSRNRMDGGVGDDDSEGGDDYPFGGGDSDYGEYDGYGDGSDDGLILGRTFDSDSDSDSSDDDDGLILRPPLSSNRYRSFELENGLSVLVVSDYRCTKAAAALAVTVGSLSDPIPGMAHLMEHVILKKEVIFFVMPIFFVILKYFISCNRLFFVLFSLKLS